MRRFYCLPLLLLASYGLRAEPAAPASPDISFTVSMSKPYTHLLEVEMQIVQPAATRNVDLVMPVWTPGSYLIREYERNVQDFAAADASGRALDWEKVNKNTWRVKTGAGREWRVTYRVYANEFTVRTNELNSDHAFWNNAALLMYLDGAIGAPATLRILPAPGWKVATGLPAITGQPNSFHADNFDILYDSPVEVSDFSVLSFEVKGVPHRIVIDGHGNYDAERMRNDVRRIVMTEADLMGEIPYHDYTFILHLRTNGGGGLEHLNSTALEFPRFNFAPTERYLGFCGLVAHEFFHLWNVKRIRPDALGPFDYTKENYTRLLWVAEGLTDYYGELVLRRAGLISDGEYLEHAAGAIQGLQDTPGRLEMSAEEASFDSWIKFYRQDENSPNSQVSYYEKGALLGLLLDLEIRKRSSGAKSLDDVMRYLYHEYYKKGRNYTPEDFQKACELMAGSGLDRFFSRYVRGTEELDYNAALNAAGLRLDTNGTDSSQPPAQRAYLGVDFNQQGDRLLINRVYAGAPAYEQGINSGDQILAIDNVRASEDFFFARLAEKKPGDVIHLTIFRNDDLRTFDVKLGARSVANYRIVPVAQPSEEQKSIYRAWIGEAREGKK